MKVVKELVGAGLKEVDLIRNYIIKDF